MLNRRNLTNIFILVLFFSTGIGIGEIILRILYKDTFINFPRYSTAVQYGDFTIRQIQPYSKFTHNSIDGSWSFTINKQGFRNTKDFEYTKPEGLIRVISLGDSHTLGFEVNQDSTYSRIIEKYFQKNKINIEVFNTGLSGFSNAEELILLENELVKYKPDFIVFGFYANDFQDNINSGIYSLNDKKELVLNKKEWIPGVKIQKVKSTIPGLQWVSEVSYFYSLLFNNAYWKFFEGNKAKAETAIRGNKTFSNYEIDLAAAIIKRMYSVSQKMGAKFIILDIPEVEEEGGIKPSVVNPLEDTVSQNSDLFISNKVLKGFSGIAKLHVSHGHRHINELTHAILGLESAKYIASNIGLRKDTL
jgi:hypothetical protein